MPKAKKQPEKFDPFAEMPTPKTICADCMNFVDDDDDLLPACAAAVEFICPVWGIEEYRPCIELNDGNCPKFEEIPECEPEPAPPTLWQRVKAFVSAE